MFGKGPLYFSNIWHRAVSPRLCTAKCYMPNVIFIPKHGRGHIKFYHSNKPMYFHNFIDKRYTLQICNTRYHRTTAFMHRYILSAENLHAASVLESYERYSNTLSSPMPTNCTTSVTEIENLMNVDWKSASVTELLDGFKSLSYYVKNKSKNDYDDRYKNVFDAMIENLSVFSNSELFEILRYLQLWLNVRSDVDNYFYHALDKECLCRLKSFSVDQVLLIIDLWYRLVSVKNHTMFNGLYMVGKKPNQLSPSQLVQFMFYLNVSRKPMINMYEIEYCFEKYLDDLTIDEMGIVAMGFFKTKTPIVNKDLVARLIKNIMYHVKDIHEITLSCLLKIIRYSLHLPEVLTFSVLLKQLVNEVPRLSIQCLTQVAHSGATAHVFEKNLMDTIIARFIKEARLCRLKDFERLVFMMSTFNYEKSNPAYDIIVQDLSRPERSKEIQAYPRVLSYTLMHMAYMDVYPKDLLNKVMTSSFIQNMYGKSMMKSGRDILFLAYSIEAEVPDYTGAKLTSKTLNYLIKTHGYFKPSENVKVSPTVKLLNEVAHTCRDVLQCNQAIYINTVLPHFMNSDIVVCLDEHNCGVPIDSIFANMSPGSIKRPPEMPIKNLRWFVFTMAAQTNYISNNLMYTGILTARERQLRRIGYTPIVIRHCEWFKLSGVEYKQDFIKTQLFQ